jgi:hypothetical protein
MSYSRQLLGLIAFAAIFSALCSEPCWADSVISLDLESQSGDTYDYSLVESGSSPIEVNAGQQIILSGLSGVTGAEVSGTLASFCPGLTVSFPVITSTSVTVVNGGGGCFFGPNVTDGTLAVDSTVTTAGTVNFEIDTPGGAVDGTTQGPVSSSPEPSAVQLLGLGALTFAALRRNLSRLAH